MNNLFNQADLLGIIERVEQLQPESKNLWGKMNVSQMLSHCNASFEMAMGKIKSPRLFIGRIIAPLIRKEVLGQSPFKKNSPTDKKFIFPENNDFHEQKAKLLKSMNEFYEGGKEICTTHPHPFFGKFTPEQWAILQWKHTDHHLRQFGV